MHNIIRSPAGRVRIMFFTLLFLFISLPIKSRANCIQKSPVTAMPIYYDASDALNFTGSTSFSETTLYPGTFTCTMPAWGIIGGKNSVDNSSPYTQQTLYLKFPGDAYVSLNISNLSPQETHPNVGTNKGSDIDANFTITLKLMKTVPTKNVMVVNSDIARINPVVIAQDSTGLTVLQNIARMISDFAYFVFNWTWPTHNYDIYYKPLMIRFVKRVTTCSFDDDNKTIVMNDINMSSLIAGENAKKLFTLNFSCAGQVYGATSRAMSAYLSSTNILPTDNSTLISPDPGSATGVGIRIQKVTSATPIKFSASPTDIGDATPLFAYAAQEQVPTKLTIPMFAWYYVYNRRQLSSGPVRTTAMVNFVYD